MTCGELPYNLRLDKVQRSIAKHMVVILKL